MAILPSLKLSAISFLLFAASSNHFVSSAAVLPDGARCGYGDAKCPEGYQCVKKNNCTITVHWPRRQSAEMYTNGALDVRTCQKIPSPTDSPLSSTSTPKPEYTLTYVSQSGDTKFPYSSGYVIKPSGFASSSNSIGRPSSASGHTSKRFDKLPSTRICTF